MKWPKKPLLLGCVLAGSLGLGACAAVSQHGPLLQADPQLDFHQIVAVFDEVRHAAGLPTARLSLEDTPHFAYAQGFNRITLDEAFVVRLSKDALRFVIAHEIGHLKNGDPRRGFEVLRDIHQRSVGFSGDAALSFPELRDRYMHSVEFQNFLASIELRADEFAAAYMAQIGVNSCHLMSEVEQVAGRQFGDRKAALCEGKMVQANLAAPVARDEDLLEVPPHAQAFQPPTVVPGAEVPDNTLNADLPSTR